MSNWQIVIYQKPWGHPPSQTHGLLGLEIVVLGISITRRLFYHFCLCTSPRSLLLEPHPMSCLQDWCIPTERPHTKLWLVMKPEGVGHLCLLGGRSLGPWGEGMSPEMIPKVSEEMWRLGMRKAGRQWVAFWPWLELPELNEWKEQQAWGAKWALLSELEIWGSRSLRRKEKAVMMRQRGHAHWACLYVAWCSLPLMQCLQWLPEEVSLHILTPNIYHMRQQKHGMHALEWHCLDPSSLSVIWKIAEVPCASVSCLWSRGNNRIHIIGLLWISSELINLKSPYQVWLAVKSQ